MERTGLIAWLEVPRLGLVAIVEEGVFEYAVVALDVVEPSATDVVAQGSRAEATHITCYPFSYVGPAPQRFVVRAALADAGRTAVATR